MDFYNYSMQNALEAQKQYLQQQLSAVDTQLAGIQQTQQSIPSLMVRIVNSMEEVNNLPCPSDGSSAYYPCPTGNKIFVKHIGNDGKIAIDTYIPEGHKDTSVSDRLNSIEARLSKLEQTGKEETITNESSTSYDA